MNRIAEFRAVMAIAERAAQQEGVAVSVLHVAFAAATTTGVQDSTTLTVQAFGDARGWGAAEERRPVRDRLLPRRRVRYDDAVRRAVEKAAASGSPDIRAMLRSILAEGGLDPLRAPVERSGGDLAQWLAADD